MKASFHWREAHRGHLNRVKILDRQGLEEGACECYAAARQELERLMS